MWEITRATLLRARHGGVFGERSGLSEVARTCNLFSRAQHRCPHYPDVRGGGLCEMTVLLGGLSGIRVGPDRDARGLHRALKQLKQRMYCLDQGGGSVGHLAHL